MVYSDPDLEAIVHAVSEQLAGKSVLIHYPEDIRREDDWRPLSTLPDSMVSIPLSIIRRKKINEWSSLWPHLFRPVMAVYAGTTKPSWFMKLTDLLAGNDFQKKSVRVRLDDIPGFGEIPEKFRDAWLFQEMMVNVSRLGMELLKVVHNRGGIVVNYAGGVPDDIVFRVEDHLSGRIIDAGYRGLFPVKKRMVGICVADRLPWSEFTMHLGSGKNRLTMFDHNGRLGIWYAGNPAPDCCARFREEWPGAEITSATDIKFVPDETGIFSKRIPPALLSVSSEASASGRKERPVEDLMESAFDLAKQTGISFRDFRALFYRYGISTEQITEQVYTLMASTRDASAIWKEATHEYEVNFEWRLPNEDKNICKT